MNKNFLAILYSGYKILFTSREDIENIKPYYLDVLSLDDAKALFNSIYPVEDEVLLEEILGYLDCHAFFVEKTAHSIKKNLTPQMLKEKFEKAYKLFRVRKYQNLKALREE